MQWREVVKELEQFACWLVVATAIAEKQCALIHLKMNPALQHRNEIGCDISKPIH